MAQILLDIAPNIHRNDNIIIHRMINAIKKIDNRKHEIIFKTQIFKEAPPNLPITEEALNFFGFCAKLAGYRWTASVFDLDSLNLLMKYEEDLPFIKIACRPDLYWLTGEIKRKIPIYMSIVSFRGWSEADQYKDNQIILACVKKYPAQKKEYEVNFKLTELFHGISDHTVGFDLWKKYEPDIIEWHYKEQDSTGPDAGPFAKTVDDLKEIL